MPVRFSLPSPQSVTIALLPSFVWSFSKQCTQRVLLKTLLLLYVLQSLRSEWRGRPSCPPELVVYWQGCSALFGERDLAKLLRPC